MNTNPHTWIQIKESDLRLWLDLADEGLEPLVKFQKDFDAMEQDAHAICHRQLRALRIRIAGILDPVSLEPCS